MTLVDSLTAWGIQDAAVVVSAATDAGLPLAMAAALLDQESGGGANVWGHDNVTVAPGTYVKGGPVTELNYRAYRTAVAAGKAGPQGCGPVQLTSLSYQDQADRLGGCWRPEISTRVGFGLLAGYAAQWGAADAFRAYNGGAGNRVHGSNVNADRYSDEAMARYATWTTRLGTEDDVALTDQDVQKIAIATTALLLNTQLSDLYPDHPTGTMTVAATLQWAAANAGRALTVSQRIRDLVTSGVAPTGDQLHEALLDALEAIGPLELIPTSALQQKG